MGRVMAQMKAFNENYFCEAFKKFLDASVAALGLAVPNRVIYGILYVRTIYYTALQAPNCTLYSILFGILYGILCNPSARPR